MTQSELTLAIAFDRYKEANYAVRDGKCDPSVSLTEFDALCAERDAAEEAYEVAKAAQ
jgi:hypothetical protein